MGDDKIMIVCCPKCANKVLECSDDSLAILKCRCDKCRTNFLTQIKDQSIMTDLKNLLVPVMAKM